MKKLQYLLPLGIAAVIMTDVLAPFSVCARENTTELTLKHHHTENCMGIVMVMQEADGNTSLQTVSESECPNCGGVVHDYVWTAECSCGQTWRSEGWACIHSPYGDNPSGCPVYREVTYDSMHEHPTRMRVCGKEETDTVGRIVITVSETEPATEVSVSASYSGSLNTPEISWREEDGKITKSSSIAVSKNGNYTMLATYSEDGVNYETSREIRIANIDRDGPVVQSVAVNTSEPTNQNVILTVEASDPAALAEKPYSLDGKEFSAVNTFEITENGEYTVYVSDRLGNITTYQTEVKNIDKNPPSMEVSISPEVWEEGECTVSLEGSDGEFGLDEMPYSFDEGKTWTNENSIVLSETKTVPVWVRDAAGNIVKDSVEAVLIPKEEEPEIAEEEITEEPEIAEDEEITEEPEIAKDEEITEETEAAEEEEIINETESAEEENITEETDIEKEEETTKETETTKERENPEEQIPKETENSSEIKETREETIPEEPKEDDSEGFIIGTILAEGTAVTVSRPTLVEAASAQRRRAVSDRTDAENETISTDGSDVENSAYGPEEFYPVRILAPDSSKKSLPEETVKTTQEKEKEDYKQQSVNHSFFAQSVFKVLSDFKTLIYKVPKSIRIITVTAGSLIGGLCVAFGIVFLFRSAGVYWVDEAGKKHFLSRNMIRRKGELYEIRIQQRSLRSSETKDVVIHLPRVFTVIHHYRPILIFFGESMLSQHVEKEIALRMPW